MRRRTIGWACALAVGSVALTSWMREHGDAIANASEPVRSIFIDTTLERYTTSPVFGGIVAPGGRDLHFRDAHGFPTYVFFVPPAGTSFTPGTVYEVAHSPGSPNLGAGSRQGTMLCGLDPISKRFIVDEVSLDGDGRPLTFAARFSCLNGPVSASEYAYGAVTYNSSIIEPTRRLSPDRLNFGTVPPRVDTPPRTMTVINDGAVPLPMHGARILKPHPDSTPAYRISSDRCTGTTVPVGGSCEIDVIGTPPGGGMYPAEWALEVSDDLTHFGGSGGRRVPLLMEATGAPPLPPPPTPFPSIPVPPTLPLPLPPPSTAAPWPIPSHPPSTTTSPVPQATSAPAPTTPGTFATVERQSRRVRGANASALAPGPKH